MKITAAVILVLVADTLVSALKLSSHSNPQKQKRENPPRTLARYIPAAYVVNLDRCALRRAIVKESLQVGEGNFSSALGIPVAIGFGSFDATKYSNERELFRKLKLSMSVDAIQDWPEGNPYEPGLHVDRAYYGTAASHYAIHQEIVEQGLPMALVFEDDFHFEQNSSIFVENVVKALSRLHDANSSANGKDWDMLYLQWYDGTVESDEEQKRQERLIFQADGHSDSGLQRVGCFAGTTSYVISQRGARKLLRLKSALFKHFIPHDDFLMALSGRKCRTKYNRAASHFAAAAATEPFKVLNSFALVNKVCIGTNVFGSTDDKAEGSEC